MPRHGFDPDPQPRGWLARTLARIRTAPFRRMDEMFALHTRRVKSSAPIANQDDFCPLCSAPLTSECGECGRDLVCVRTSSGHAQTVGLAPRSPVEGDRWSPDSRTTYEFDGAAWVRFDETPRALERPLASWEAALGSVSCSIERDVWDDVNSEACIAEALHFDTGWRVTLEGPAIGDNAHTRRALDRAASFLAVEGSRWVNAEGAEQAEEGGAARGARLPFVLDCGCSRLKVQAGLCTMYDRDGRERTPPPQLGGGNA